MREELKRRMLEEFRSELSPDPERAQQNWAAVRAGFVPGVPASVGLGLGAKVALATFVVAGVGGLLIAGSRGRADRELDSPTGTRSTASAKVDDVLVEAERELAWIEPPGGSDWCTSDDMDEVTSQLEVERPEKVAVVEPASSGHAGRERSNAAGSLPQSDSAGASRGTDLEEEIKIIAAAKRALGAGDNLEVLRILRTHSRRFPNGRLVDERTLLRVQALCRAGRVAAAARVKESFLARHPDASIASRLRAICAEHP